MRKTTRRMCLLSFFLIGYLKNALFETLIKKQRSAPSYELKVRNAHPVEREVPGLSLDKRECNEYTYVTTNERLLDSCSAF